MTPDLGSNVTFEQLVNRTGAKSPETSSPSWDDDPWTSILADGQEQVCLSNSAITVIYQQPKSNGVMFAQQAKLAQPPKTLDSLLKQTSNHVAHANSAIRAESGTFWTSISARNFSVADNVQTSTSTMTPKYSIVLDASALTPTTNSVQSSNVHAPVDPSSILVPDRQTSESQRNAGKSNHVTDWSDFDPLK